MLEVAELAMGEARGEYRSIAVMLAVDSGILSADVISCKLLMSRYAGISHDDSPDQLGYALGNKQHPLVQDYRRLLGFRRTSHYGDEMATESTTKTAMRIGQRLLKAAQSPRAIER